MGYEELFKLRFPACSALYDRQINQTFCILDMKGIHMGMWNKVTMGIIKKASQISQDYYPECMGKMVVCNAPFLFTGIYAVVKGWVDEKTRRKIAIHGSNYMRVLLEYIDEDQIPDFLGGTNRGPLGADAGPWQNYEVVDSQDPNGVVGVRRKDDPLAKIFTPTDQLAL